MAGAIADAIAGALLLEPQRYVVESDIVLEDITKVYAIMLEHCDVHMGFKLIPEGYANWVTLTRAYYETQYVFVTADPDIHALADLAPGRPIGATVGTSAHIRLVSYLTALPAEDRWPAYPDGHQRARPGVASQRHGRRRPRLGARACGPSSATTLPTPTFT